MGLDPALVERVFAAVLQKPAAERERYLDEACGGEAQLLEQVRELLAQHDAGEGFLQARTLASAPIAEGPGSRIGRYKLLQLIGEGGFGLVFMAEQEHPVRRKVAVKIIKLGMDTRQVIARFEVERQALAMMDHPNIAKVFDAGATETGRPYFVMELVRGVPITDYCDRNSLSTHHRLELFVKVCAAIQHAHTKGIIHRDIKPSNVLITLHDGVPVPKVIDFGIAKATNAELTERTLFTEFRQMIGTPAYMSPEQAEMSGLDIDTRSDVYSLGVLLYELLTGTTPIDSANLMRHGMGEIQRIIREEEPPKPSTRVSTLGNELVEVARRRGIEPRRLGPAIRGDLDWIVMRAMEKDRTRRYETANALAQDVLRHLRDEPVVARPASASYRMRKFIRRHKGSAAAVAGIALALVLGIAGTTLAMLHARSAQRAAEAANNDATHQRNVALGLLADVERARQAAEKQARRAEAANQFTRNMFAAARADPAHPGADVRVADVLDQAAEALDRLVDQPELQLDGRLTLARTYDSFRAFDKAANQYFRARLVSQKLAGEESEQTLQITVDWLFDLANGQWPFDVEPLAKQTAQTAQRLFGLEHPLTYDALNSYALILNCANRKPEAEKILLGLVERARRNRTLVHPKGSARYYSNLARTYRDTGRIELASAIEAEAAAVAATEPQTDPARVILYRKALADELFDADRLEEAELALESLLQDSQRLFGPSHPDSITIQRMLLATNRRLGRWKRCAELLNEMIELFHAARIPSIGAELTARFALAEAILRDGRVAEARPMLRATVADLQTAGRKNPALRAASQDFWVAGQLLENTPFYQPTPQRRSALQAWGLLATQVTVAQHRWGPSPPAIRWEGYRFAVRRWNGAATPPGGPPAAAGGLGELASLPQLDPGVYLMSVEIPRPGTFSAREAQWMLVADWDLAFYRAAGLDLSSEQAWKKLSERPPSERRRSPALVNWAYAALEPGFGPRGRTDAYAMLGQASVTAPPGFYRVNVSHDGACRVFLDATKIYDSAATQPQDHPIELDAASHTLRVEAINTSTRLLVQLIPSDPAAAAMYHAMVPWPVPALNDLERTAGLIADDPRSADARKEHAQVLGRLGRFKEAKDAFAEAVALDPDARYISYQYAVLLARFGEYPALRDHVRSMAQRFAASPEVSAPEQIAKVMSLLPLEQSGFRQEELGRVGAWLDHAMRNDPAWPWSKMARGMLEYRMGHDEDDHWLAEAAEQLKDNPQAAAVCKLFRAMSLHRRGENQAAARLLAAAEEAIQRNNLTLSDLESGQRDLDNSFHDMIMAPLVLGEAKRLMAKSPGQ